MQQLGVDLFCSHYLGLWSAGMETGSFEVRIVSPVLLRSVFGLEGNHFVYNLFSLHWRVGVVDGGCLFDALLTYFLLRINLRGVRTRSCPTDPLRGRNCHLVFRSRFRKGRVSQAG